MLGFAGRQAGISLKKWCPDVKEVLITTRRA
jgi:hypothetical protein